MTGMISTPLDGAGAPLIRLIFRLKQIFSSGKDYPEISQNSEKVKYLFVLEWFW